MFLLILRKRSRQPFRSDITDPVRSDASIFDCIGPFCPVLSPDNEDLDGIISDPWISLRVQKIHYHRITAEME
jgi:hypothetical protein